MIKGLVASNKKAGMIGDWRQKARTGIRGQKSGRLDDKKSRNKCEQ
jgi:hypothetical protein